MFTFTKEHYDAARGLLLDRYERDLAALNHLFAIFTDEPGGLAGRAASTPPGVAASANRSTSKKSPAKSRATAKAKAKAVAKSPAKSPAKAKAVAVPRVATAGSPLAPDAPLSMENTLLVLQSLGQTFTINELRDAALSHPFRATGKSLWQGLWQNCNEMVEDGLLTTRKDGVRRTYSKTAKFTNNFGHGAS